MRIWCKKSISSLTSFLLYCREIANLLLWVIWALLATYLNDNINVKKTLTFICRQKMKFIFRVSLEILQRYCEVVVSGILNIPGYTNPKWYYQLAEKYCLSAGKKITLVPHAFLEILQRLLILGTLGMPSYTHPKWYYQLVEYFYVYLHAQNKLHHSLLSWDITF